MDSNEKEQQQALDPSKTDAMQVRMKAQKTWAAEINASTKELETFHKRGREINDAYIYTGKTKANGKDHLFNLWKVTVNTQRDAIYSSFPSPTASRMYLDPNDAVGRVAGELLERAMNTEDVQSSRASTAYKNIVQDYLCIGGAFGWVRYVTKASDEEQLALSGDVDDETAELPNASPLLKDERIEVDHVNWEDVRWSPARTADEVRWIARKVYMPKSEFEERFPDADNFDYGEDDEQVNEAKSDNPSGPQNIVIPEVEVWEIWDKTSLQVFFMREGCAKILEIKDDPYGLPEFFPAVFLFGNHTTGNYIPNSDYIDAQYQYKQLNKLTARIDALIDSARVTGVYDASIPELQHLISKAQDGELLPIEKYGALAANQGLKGSVDFLPLDQFITGLNGLTAQRNDVKQQIYELTGISDIIRGSTSPYETKGAQQMKAQFASARLQAKAREVAEFFSGIYRVKGFLMVKFYEPQRFIARAGTINPADQQYVQQAYELLKNEEIAFNQINVSVDTLQQDQWSQEQTAVVSFITTIGTMLEQTAPLIQQDPTMKPLIYQALLLGASRFRAAKTFEGFLSSQLSQAMQQLQGQAPGSNPAADKEAAAQQAEQQQAQQAQQQAAQADQAKLQATTDIEKGKAATAVQIKQMELAANEQIKAREAAIAAAEVKLKELEMNQAGIDTTGVTLAIGDANPTMRPSKEEVAGMLAQHQQHTQDQSMQMFQQMMQAMQLMQQQSQAFQQQLLHSLSEPMPPSVVTIKNADGTVKMTGEIK
ncbi:hypothetical protein [Variovorax sp. LG9.2]|uniref:portal protein n=1 Tax=Variovorax sp. LG9.2 TaxID=3048626 RepID=UPI002B22771B|nr:hypothetical protein [Variovorax sp. LG9.2]MEB0057304.1 hypothetical protein [Variovorax sp. LG9.2]